MDVGKRGSKPRGHNVYTLDENSAGECEDNSQANTRGHEEILRPARDIPARHRDRWLGNIKRKKHWSKRPTRYFTPQLYSPFKVLDKNANKALELDILACCKIHLVFHISLLKPYKVSDRHNREQAPWEPEEVEGDLEWEVERILKSDIITYTRKVRRVNKKFKELRYFVKWARCSEDENTWEPQEGLENAREEVEKFHREKPEMPGPNLIE